MPNWSSKRDNPLNILACSSTSKIRKFRPRGGKPSVGQSLIKAGRVGLPGDGRLQTISCRNSHFSSRDHAAAASKPTRFLRVAGTIFEYWRFRPLVHGFMDSIVAAPSSQTSPKDCSLKCATWCVLSFATSRYFTSVSNLNPSHFCGKNYSTFAWQPPQTMGRQSSSDVGKLATLLSRASTKCGNNSTINSPKGRGAQTVILNSGLTVVC